MRATVLHWRHLVFGPQQIHTAAVDGRADEVQAVVGNAEVEVAEAEDEPAERRGGSLTLLLVDRQARQSPTATSWLHDVLHSHHNNAQFAMASHRRSSPPPLLDFNQPACSLDHTAYWTQSDITSRFQNLHDVSPS